MNNINHSLLSKNDVTQLVLLFEDKYTKTYSFERLLGCLIDDLITIEKTGKQIDDSILKGTIVANNLGAICKKSFE